MRSWRKSPRWSRRRTEGRVLVWTTPPLTLTLSPQRGEGIYRRFKGVASRCGRGHNALKFTGRSRLNVMNASEMNHDLVNPDQIPSPLGGERVRVRGARRNRTISARDFARHLRKESTDAEKRMWRLLRDRRFVDFKFRRQYPCGVTFSISIVWKQNWRLKWMVAVMVFPTSGRAMSCAINFWRHKELKCFAFGIT